MPGAVIIEGHIQGLANTRALGKAGVPVIVVDKTTCVAKHSKYCKGFYISPAFDSDEFAQFLLDLAIKHSLQDWLLLPSNDHALLTITRNKQQLLKYYKIIGPDMPVLNNIYDKVNLISVARKAGVATPLSYTLTHSDSVAPVPDVFPVITKGRYGLSFYKAAGKKAFISYNIDQLKSNLGKIEKLIPLEETFTQEVIPYNGTNRTVSFTAFSIKGVIKTHWTGKKIREHPERFGTATMCESVDSAGLIDPSAKLVRYLNYTGVCEIEYILDPRDNTYKLIEINARTWLWTELARVAGVDYANIIHNYATGVNPAYPEDYIKGVKWVNYITDIPYAFLSVIRGKLSPAKIIRSYKGKRINPLFRLNDPAPFFAYLLFLPKYLLKR